MSNTSDRDEPVSAFINDMNDTKEAIVNLLDTLKKMNLALTVIADNQNHLNSKFNQLIKLFNERNDTDDQDKSLS